MEENQNGEGFNLKAFLFGKIKKKLGWAFGILIVLIVILVIVTYTLNSRISKDTTYIREVNAPLEIMAEHVISYDAMLTGLTHESLLHAEKGEGFKEHRTEYDQIGIKLDNLIKVEAPALLNKSRRSIDEKNKVYSILKELDRVNLLLVDLELGAFDAMEKGDLEKASLLIVGGKYHEYKAELTDLYEKWSDEETRITEGIRQRVLDNSRDVRLYNLYLEILFILIAGIVPFLILRLISTPIVNLKDMAENLKKNKFDSRVKIKTGDELEELGDTFNKMAETLGKTDAERKQIDKAKSEFLSITSHELRSPMTPMKAQLQMVLGDYFGKITKEQRESLQIVLNNTERLDKIIVDFLEISRIEAARLKFNFIRADLTKTVGLVIDEMKGFMPEKKIKIETKVEKLPTIEVDPDRVSQVLRNLINNAIKFSPENGKIEVSAKLSNNMILFSVKDHGVGIAEKDQRKLFEPFYQVENMYQHKSGGTGLGLAISKGIVESQNGKIWLSSQEGKGTTFYFTVPLKPVREIKAIKLLFSEAEKTDEIQKGIFKEFLGPLGEKEFETLSNSKGITIESIKEYTSYLAKTGVLKKDKSEEFKNKIAILFNRGEKEVTIDNQKSPEKKFISAFEDK
jgi:signal transduction histidine kinase